MEANGAVSEELRELEPMEADEDSENTPSKDPDYEPEVVPADQDDSEAELSLAERLRTRSGRRRRGRPRKTELQALKEYEPVVKPSRSYSRHQSAANNDVMSLLLECDEDNLSPAQLSAQKEANKEFKQAQDKINEMIKNQTILFQTKQTMVLQTASNSLPVRTAQAPLPKVAIPPTPKVVTMNQIKVNTTTPQVIAAKPGQTILRTQNRQNVQLLQTGGPNNVTYLLQGTKGNQATVLRAMPANQVRLAPQKVALTTPTPSTVQPPVGTVPLGQITLPPAPQQPLPGAETVDLTQEDTVDSREITFNKLSGKTFPSLVVSARPSLRMKEMTPSTMTRERATLDSKVKTVLVHSPTKFTEWLIQQGLVRSEQVCSLHRDHTGAAFKLKLGMYSDNTKFPFSGGYVWISECCPTKFVSVFSGSLFESSPHPPTILLKLIYHWCCQTSVNNVVQWVKVDNFYVKNFFTLVRAVCTAAVHTKMGFIGGMNRYVEVGVISLGTTSQDGNQRQVKVEVLGVLDHEAKRVRLMAVEPMAESDRNLRKRFSKILEPLTTWVHPASTILTDFSIDKSTLQALGFNNVYQNNAAEAGTMLGGKRRNNSNIMDYLRKVVPRMFLNTLSLLNRSLIQQFLDELTWREQWGFSPPLTFDNIIAHLAEQTKAEYGEQLVNRLSSIAVNPFKNWNYHEPSKVMQVAYLNITPAAALAPAAALPSTASDFEVTPASLCEVQYAPGPAHSKRPRAQKTPQPIMDGGAQSRALSAASAIKRVKLNTSAQTYLDAFYYADMSGQANYVIQDQDSNFNVKCIICPNTFYNNIALMKHLIAHVVYETNDAGKAGKDLYCSYCLKKVSTTANLASHKKDCHMMNTASTSCCICQRKFQLRSQLIQHMNVSHVASEMPYRCNVCHYRTSFHYKLVDHFYETHTGGCSMQCPLCLKVFFASGNRSRVSTTNLMAFYQHLVGHKRQSNRRKCERCCLIFQQTKHVFEHEDLDHQTMRNVPRVVPVVSTESNPTIIIPTPSASPPVSQADRAAGEGANRHAKGGASSYNAVATAGGANYTKRPHYPPLNLNCDDTDICIECRQPFTQRLHLSHYMNCLLCRYSTSCSNAIEKHLKMFHSGKKNKQSATNRDTTLPQPMFCICGFKSDKGNELASHLEECERRSAYPQPPMEAQSASFPPLVNLEGASVDDLSDKWMQAYVTPKGKEEEKQLKPDDGSIMGFLGLVRKPSTDEEPKKEVAPEEEEVEPLAELPVAVEMEEDKEGEVEDVTFDDMDDPPMIPVEAQVTESNEVMDLGD